MIIAIDPDINRPSVAIFNGTGRVEELLKLPRYNYTQYFQEINSLVEKGLTANDCTVVVEGQWLGKDWKTVEKLIEVRAEMTMLFRIAGIRVETIHPSKWQVGILDCPQSRVELKKAAKAKATEIFGKPIPDPHYADAVCLGYYWLSKK